MLLSLFKAFYHYFFIFFLFLQISTNFHNFLPQFMTTIRTILDHHPRLQSIDQTKPQTSIKNQQEYKELITQTQDDSRFLLQNHSCDKTNSLAKPQSIQQIFSHSISSKQLTHIPTYISDQFQITHNQIVEEKDAKDNTNFQYQFFLNSTNLLLSHHPNSAFKTIPTTQKIQKRKYNKKVAPVIVLNSINSNHIQTKVEAKAKQGLVKIQDEVKQVKIESKTKQIQKNPNFKHRKGKNQQPMAQKFIKKMSGFHYNKNYKQNRNKTLKKLAKRGLRIDLSNFSEYIGRLKLQINKKYTKWQMRSKMNTKGQLIDPRRYYQSYRQCFPEQKERDFVQRLYSVVFKRVYVIMWKSDERLRRIQRIRIEGVNYECGEMDLGGQGKREMGKEEGEEGKEGQMQEEQRQQQQRQQEQQRTQQKLSLDKRAGFVQCLDQEGKIQLQGVFDQEYNRLYDGYDWGNTQKRQQQQQSQKKQQDRKKQQSQKKNQQQKKQSQKKQLQQGRYIDEEKDKNKESFKKRLIAFCWIDD